MRNKSRGIQWMIAPGVLVTMIMTTYAHDSWTRRGIVEVPDSASGELYGAQCTTIPVEQNGVMCPHNDLTNTCDGATGTPTAPCLQLKCPWDCTINGMFSYPLGTPVFQQKIDCPQITAKTCAEQVGNNCACTGPVAPHGCVYQHRVECSGGGGE